MTVAANSTHDNDSDNNKQQRHCNISFTCVLYTVAKNTDNFFLQQHIAVVLVIVPLLLSNSLSPSLFFSMCVCVSVCIQCIQYMYRHYIAVCGLNSQNIYRILVEAAAAAIAIAVAKFAGIYSCIALLIRFALISKINHKFKRE